MLRSSATLVIVCRSAAVVFFFLAVNSFRSDAQILLDSKTLTVSGKVTDPQSSSVPGVPVLLFDSHAEEVGRATTDSNGHFSFNVSLPGTYTIKVSASGFRQVTQKIEVGTQSAVIADILLGEIETRLDSITVTADVKETSILFPDPAQRVFVRQETLDANPGRPGAPISIPGLPIESASGGIKAPQYFSPGVAGDHGEPIAQYIQIGGYLLSNNLSSNAHGNGYADPNILVPPILEGVQTDGGAFNVREGNHAENLAAIYQLRSRSEPFVTVTGDYRDVDLVAGWSPGNPQSHTWLAIEAAYGNGFLRRLEHRQQYKLNGFRVWNTANHQLTLFGIGYFGTSFIPGLVALGVPNPHDTIDSRQRDQTHTGLIAANDLWRLGLKAELQLSGMFRTYNLALDSNFGDGLIRQSEFRTVTGGNATYIKSVTKNLLLLMGGDYQRDAPRRLNLDRYESTEPSNYGPFQKITSNNVTIGDTAPYVASYGKLPFDFHYYLGWRRDEIQFVNQDLLHPANSYSTLAGVNSPKATFSYLPENHPFLPAVAFSFGEAFYTNDPRIGVGTAQGTPVSRAHSYQLVASKRIAKTDVRLTLGYLTTEATLAKIVADTGLQQDEGPGKNKFVTLAARRSFTWGFLQGSISKADARDLDSGSPIPEAPRLIVDVLGTLDRLPWGLHARGEFEEVGAKPLGDGLVGVPVREFRGAFAKSFRQESMNVGVNFLIATGYTGQTTEIVASSGDFAQPVGMRIPSYISLSYSYRFGRKVRP